MVFDFYEGENINELSVYFAADWRNSFLKRIMMCFNFLFNKEPFIWTDGVIINDLNVHQLEHIISEIKKSKVKTKK